MFWVFFNTNIVEILLKLGYIREKLYKYLVKQRVKCLSSGGGHNVCNLPLKYPSKPSLETWLGLAKILKGQQTDMCALACTTQHAFQIKKKIRLIKEMNSNKILSSL